MELSERNKILKRIEKIEAFAKAALEEATAARKDLESGGALARSPQKGKVKAAANSVLKNRRIHITKKKKD